MSDTVQVEVSLLGRHFTIATPPSERETLEEAVRLLGEKIATIQSHGRIVDADKIAIMAALNIAHDLLKTNLGEGLEMAQFQRKIRSMVDAADAALGTVRPVSGQA